MKNNILYITEFVLLLYFIRAICLECTGGMTPVQAALAIIAGLWLLLYWAVNYHYFGREFNHGYDDEDDI